MNKKHTEISDKYLVDASSANDLDGCAATEATGLIPFLPESESEIDSYRQVFPYSPDCLAKAAAVKDSDK